MTPVHFDAEACVQAYLAALKNADEGGPDWALNVRFFSAVMPGMIRFHVGEMNRGTAHQHIAGMTGFGLSVLAGVVIENESCGCVRGRIKKEFLRGLSGKAAPGPVIEFSIAGSPGGHA